MLQVMTYIFLKQFSACILLCLISESLKENRYSEAIFSTVHVFQVTYSKAHATQKFRKPKQKHKETNQPFACLTPS